MTYRRMSGALTAKRVIQKEMTGIGGRYYISRVLLGMFQSWLATTMSDWL